MSNQVRFGVFVPQIYPWPEMKETAHRLEALGYDSLWLARADLMSAQSNSKPIRA